jgi:cytochrome c peroxidase
MPKNYRIIILLILCGIFSINVAYFLATSPKESAVSQNIKTQYTLQYVNGPIQPLPKIAYINKDWVILGKALFHSPLLSRDNSIACINCHDINNGGDDGFPISFGINNRKGFRNTPSILNSSLNFRQFWDGRNVSLVEQVHGPIHNPTEMDTNFTEIINKLKKETMFVDAFEKLDDEGITEKNIIQAIVIYEESLLSPNAAIDRYLLGDKLALTLQQKKGLMKFEQFGCVTCHQGRNIGGNIYQKLGRINEAPKHLLKDTGRYQVTNDLSDLHVFKVPSLRNVALTAPYFHNGSVGNLSDAVKLMAKLQLGLIISQEDTDDIVALLHAFTGDVNNIKSR